tara:strand:- start:292 stop:525 length:234 start_codon:yes stop_codon:yes gene_type:complete
MRDVEGLGGLNTSIASNSNAEFVIEHGETRTLPVLVPITATVVEVAVVFGWKNCTAVTLPLSGGNEMGVTMRESSSA